MNRWFLRMARWAHRPPSPQRVKLVLTVLAIVLLIYGIERMGLWPDWATATRMRR